MRGKIARLLLLLLTLGFGFQCKTKTPVYKTQTTQYRVQQDTSTFSNVNSLSFIELYKDSLNKSMNTVLVFSKQALTKELPEGNLGNYCADACLRQAETICKKMNLEKPDFCFLNHGGLRASLPKGNITIGNVFELMPFENELVYMKVSRSILDSILNYTAIKGGAPVSGIKFQLKNNGVAAVIIRDRTIDTTKEFLIITSDYIANGGDGYSFLKTEKTISLGIKVRDALMNDLKNIGDNKDSLFAEKDGRIIKI